MKISQKQKLLELLKDGEPHRTDEIVAKVYGVGMSLSRVGARIWDLKQDGYVFEPGRRDRQNPKLYYYQLKIAKTYELDNRNQARRPARQGSGDLQPQVSCCKSFEIFETHSLDCVKAKQNEPQTF